MNVCNWLLILLRRPRTASYTVSENEINEPPTLSQTCTTSQRKRKWNYDRLHQLIDKGGDYDHHDILRSTIKTGRCKWHLNINRYENAIEIAEKFHENKGKSKLSSNVIDVVDTLQKITLKLICSESDQKTIDDCFKQARKTKSLLPILQVYTTSQSVSTHLNQHLAANTRHALDFYCTLLNCPILARTQEYTDTFTSILFHPELDRYIVRQTTVYRGAIFKDRQLIGDYKKGDTIITTTVLSTSMDYTIAETFATRSCEDEISIIWTYKLNNTKRRTALDLQEMTRFGDEKEILIIPFVPFTVTLIEEMDHGRTIKIFLDECQDKHCKNNPPNNQP